MPPLLRTDADLRAALPALWAAPALALDTEFHPEKAYFPKLMLVQLGPVGGEPIIVDPLGSVNLRLLGEVLSKKRLLVHGGAQDLLLIQRELGAVPTEVFDTQLAAGFAGLGYPRRLQDLLVALGGPELEKGETLSDWSRRPLSADQLGYAVDDIRVLPGLVETLEARLERFGNREIFAAAQAEVLAMSIAPPDDDIVWRRVPGAHLLSPPERAALRELAGWREARARGLDTAPGHLVSDAVLLDLVRRRPTTVERLRENRRMPSQVWRQYGEEVLAVLQGSSETIPPPPLARGPRVDALRLAARLVAESRGIAGDLLLTESELNYILEEKHSEGWRRRALGPEFQDLLEERLLMTASGRLIRAQPR